MTDRLQRLADMAMNIVASEAVTIKEYGFSLNTSDASLTFFMLDGNAQLCYCRARIGELGDQKCPGEFAEEALKGNFFWQATDGATISLNTTENSLYLTDRFDEGAFEDEEAFQNYLDGFLRTLFDWQERLDSYMTEKEVAK